MKRRGTPALTSGINMKFSPRSKRSQMKLSFGMIFSIILIIVFVALAFFVIKKFLGAQDSVKIGQFKDQLESDVNKIWKGSQGSQKVEYFLPSAVEYVCFANYQASRRGPKQSYYNDLKTVYYEYENMFFYPVGSGAGLDGVEIPHIDIEKITDDENPYCIENKKGKVELTIEKDFGETLVSVTR